MWARSRVSTVQRTWTRAEVGAGKSAVVDDFRDVDAGLGENLRRRWARLPGRSWRRTSKR